MFARRLLREGETVCEYKGERVSEAEIARRYPGDMDGLNHTFVFGLEYDLNIDAGANGNIARWINHACEPNCDTYEKDKRIYVRVIRDIRPGEEISYDYAGGRAAHQSGGGALALLVRGEEVPGNRACAHPETPEGQAPSRVTARIVLRRGYRGTRVAPGGIGRG